MATVRMARKLKPYTLSQKSILSCLAQPRSAVSKHDGSRSSRALVRLVVPTQAIRSEQGWSCSMPLVFCGRSCCKVLAVPGLSCHFPEARPAGKCQDCTSAHGQNKELLCTSYIDLWVLSKCKSHPDSTGQAQTEYSKQEGAAPYMLTYIRRLRWR